MNSLFVALLLTLTGDPSGTVNRYHESGVVIRTIAPEVAVEGFPLLVVVETEKTAESFPGDSTAQKLLDFAEKEPIMTGVLVELLPVGSNDGALRWGHPYEDVGDVPFRPQTLSIVRGQSVAIVTDLTKFPYISRGWPFPLDGVRHLRYTDYSTGVSSEPVTIRFRPPTPAEKRVAAAMNQVTGSWFLSWFPYGVFEIKTIPSGDGLPIETRRPLEIMRILHAAMRSDAEGLDALEAASGLDWGYLRGFFSALRLELLLRLKRSADAAAVRTQMLSDPAAAPFTVAVDRNLGIIGRLVAMKAAGDTVNYFRIVHEQGVARARARLAKESPPQVALHPPVLPPKEKASGWVRLAAIGAALLFALAVSWIAWRRRRRRVG
jgi:hypothetical protein